MSAVGRLAVTLASAAFRLPPLGMLPIIPHREQLHEPTGMRAASQSAANFCGLVVS